MKPPLQIIYEDNHLIAVNKAVSDLVQGDKTGDVSLIERLKHYLKVKYDKPGNVFLGLIHRIDRPVSGVVIYAKTSKALTRMNKLIKNREVKKQYFAIVAKGPDPETGTLKHYLERNRDKNKSIAKLYPSVNAKEAVLNYKTLAKSDNYTLLEIDLITGRHHQIRAQLSTIGSPIKGDLKYGFPRSNPDAGISLHACKMSFIHPVSNEKIEIIAMPPDDALWNYFVKTLKL